MRIRAGFSTLIAGCNCSRECDRSSVDADADWTYRLAMRSGILKRGTPYRRATVLRPI
jgi:hypothetical protein